MTTARERLEALISDSGMFRAGQQHERERISGVIRGYMQFLDRRSSEYRACLNMLHAINLDQS